MPTSIQDFLAAYKAGITGTDETADTREGSVFEIVGGGAAMLWSQASQQDEDRFADVLTATADGDALTYRIAQLRGVDRILDTPGTGTATLSRAGTTPGWFYEGTEIRLEHRDGVVDPILFEVAADTYVTTTAATLPVRSKTNGNAAVSVRATDDVYPRLNDIVWDTWTVQTLTCDAGTTFEPADAYQARSAAAVLARRAGFDKAIIKACRDAGAATVFLISAGYAGSVYDVGMNAVYVGDASFNTPAGLIPKCMLVLESVRILGDSMQILPIQSSTLSVNATVVLNVQPTQCNLAALTARINNTLVGVVNNELAYSLDAMRGAIFKACPDVQDMTFTTPVADATVMVSRSGGFLGIPYVLTRYTLRPDDIILTFQGPQ